MNCLLSLCLVLGITIEFSDGRSSIAFKEPSRCGDWIPYKDEKCVKIAHKAGHQTQEDAEIVCEAFSAELNRESYPKQISIKTEDEQLFLQRFLFVENHIMDDVWLGLKETDTLGEYKWNDGSSAIYSNWASQNVTDKDHRCVAMASGKGHDEEGLWVKVHCEKRIALACERTQTWSLETLQNMFLNQKLEVQRQQNISEKKIHNLEVKHHEALQTIATLEEKNAAFEQKLIALEQKGETNDDERKLLSAIKLRIFRNKRSGNLPVGFIYIQYPNQSSPADLWPFANWRDVSSSYAGLFFRVVGGDAAAFGDLQEANDTRLAEVERLIGKEGYGRTSIPSDGTWSLGIHTGDKAAQGGYIASRFRLSSGEVRPRNKAVVVWQRIK